MAHVFISHKTEDVLFAEKIRSCLELADLSVWISPSGIEPGENWIEAIDRAIENSFVVIVIVTDEALLSQWVAYEWTLALSLGKELVPLTYKPTKIRMHEKLGSRQFERFTDIKKVLQESHRLVERLQKIEKQQNVASKPTEHKKSSKFNLEQIRVQMSEGEYAKRVQAMRLIGTYKIIEVIPELISNLFDTENWIIRQAAAQTFGILPISDDEIIEALKQVVSYDTDEDVRFAARQTLDKIAPYWDNNGSAQLPIDLSDLPF